MIKGSKVLVGLSKSKGVVKELDELVGSILVVHKVMLDGREKEIEQWYSQDAVTEVIEPISELDVSKAISEISVTTKESGKKIGKTLKKIKGVELGVVPEKGDSDGK